MMIRSAFAVAAVLLIGRAAHSQNQLQQTLLAQEKKFIEAIKQQDRATLENMLGEEKFAVTPGSGRQTGAETLRRLEGVTLTSYSLDDVKCAEISPDVGMLTYRFTWTGTRSGRPVPETTVLATSTWARRGGQWKSVFYQETALCDAESDDQGVKNAAAGFHAALNELFAGNVEPMSEIWSHSDDVTYLGPAGGLLVGWDQVLESWRKQAALNLGGEVRCEDLHVAAGEKIGVVTCRIEGTNTVDGKRQKVSIRASSTFRKESGEWKMIGHHTDLLPFLSN